MQLVDSFEAFCWKLRWTRSSCSVIHQNSIQIPALISVGPKVILDLRVTTTYVFWIIQINLYEALTHILLALQRIEGKIEASYSALNFLLWTKLTRKIRSFNVKAANRGKSVAEQHAALFGPTCWVRLHGTLTMLALVAYTVWSSSNFCATSPEISILWPAKHSTTTTMLALCTRLRMRIAGLLYHLHGL